MAPHIDRSSQSRYESRGLALHTNDRVFALKDPWLSPDNGVVVHVRPWVSAVA